MNQGLNPVPGMTRDPMNQPRPHHSKGVNKWVALVGGECWATSHQRNKICIRLSVLDAAAAGIHWRDGSRGVTQSHAPYASPP